MPAKRFCERRLERRFPANMDVMTNSVIAHISAHGVMREVVSVTLYYYGVPVARATAPSRRVALRRLWRAWVRDGMPVGGPRLPLDR